MKKILSYIVLSASLSVGACSGFLDKNPTDQLSTSLFWQSRSDFENALTAVYGTLQRDMYSSGAPNWDALTDNGYGQHNYYGSNAIVQGNIFPSSGGYISDIYTSSYQGIARTNIFMENLEKYDGSDVSESLKNKMLAEAKFVRGYFYLQLFQAYGSVPVVTEPLNFETQFQPKSPDSDVFAQVVADLEDAISGLPDVPFYSGEGHAVRSSAQALLLRAYMFVAYDESGTADMAILQQAKQLCDQLLESGYQLAGDLPSVFQSGSQEGNQEIIFSIKFLAPDNYTAMDQWYGDWVVVSPLESMVDQFEEGDLRLDQTIFDDFVDWGDGDVHMPSNNRPTGYGVKKFLTPSLIPYGYATRSDQDWVVARFAEILLLKAEIDNELSGPSQGVYEAINAVRNRSGLEGLSSELSQGQMREAIRHERRIELAFEGLRYYDLKRWRIAEEVLNGVADGVIPYRFEERFYQWPLPQSEIDKSNGVLEQNPNY